MVFINSENVGPKLNLKFHFFLFFIKMPTVYFLLVVVIFFFSATKCGSGKPIIKEPQFISPGIISKTFNPVGFHKDSPFYSNEKQIYNMLETFIKENKANKALEMLRLVVFSERKWRMELCLRFFGWFSCNETTAMAAPFFIWQKQFAHQLLRNPTSEIINNIEHNVSVKFFNKKT